MVQPLLWSALKLDLTGLMLITAFLNRPPVFHVPHDLELWEESCKPRKSMIDSLELILEDDASSSYSSLLLEYLSTFQRHCPHAKIELMGCEHVLAPLRDALRGADMAFEAMESVPFYEDLDASPIVEPFTAISRVVLKMAANASPTLRS